MKKYCLIIQSSSNDTGVASYIKSLLYFFENDNINITIISNKNGWKKYYPNIIRFYENQIIEYLRKILIFFRFKKIGIICLSVFDKIINHLSKEKYDLIIFPTASSLTYFMKSDYIVSVHDLMHIYEKKFNESGGFLTFIYRQNLYKNISKKSFLILVDSKIGKNQFIESYKCQSNKIKILEFCCPSYIYDNYPTLNLEMYGDYLFYPASFWPHKNHKNLILAFNKIKNHHKELNLVFSGKKTLQYKKLLKIITNLNLNDRIFFVGYVKDEDLKSYYHYSRALIMPTFYGPTNIPPIEALYSDTPVLVSDIYGMRDQMEDYAIYFDPSSIKSISNSIDFLLNNNFKSKNLKKLKEKFSLNTFTKKFKKILNHHI